ncbi:MAG TPA: MFS transporter [Myxococcales bacterium]|nr:MFS transporter [Deltaproteobacteria bacterium]MBU48168.1 MFS transporter [Deltaproteobacteria bacterium]HAA58084.1 MFS transporter [Myxococcales bacterium]|tara:strand:- start:8287 stop:9567 length:1281 start_codon:yes stop_codon:yes gene_type:complete
MKTSTKFIVLTSLYLSQGLPFGFFTQALPVLMHKEGISLQLIGLTSLLALPWACKFLWAPLIDNSKTTKWGKYRRWIIPLQSMTAFMMFLLSFLDIHEGLWIVCGGFLLANALAATQDIATDGLAVTLLSHEERGLGNGLQVAGYRVGMILGGGPLLLVFHYMGWRVTFMGIALLLLIATLPIIWTQEPEATKTWDEAKETSYFAGLYAFIKRPGMLVWLLVLFLYKGGDAFATGMLRPFLSSQGLDLKDIGWLLGTAGFTAGLLGALVGGWGVHLLGRKRSLIAFGLFQAASVGAYILLTLSSSTWLLYTVCSVEHFAGGMATVALFTAMMDRCHPDQAATDYTLQASIVVIATGSAAAVSGFSAASLGYAHHFLLATGLCITGVIASAYFLRGTADRVTQHPDTLTHSTPSSQERRPCNGHSSL